MSIVDAPMRQDDGSTPASGVAISSMLDVVGCPACGYDLRGVMGGSVRSGARATCPECGLDVSDGAALGIGQAGPTWWIESHAARGVAGETLVRAAVSSAVMAHQPWRLWKSLRPGHASKPRRLLLMVLVPWIALATLLVGLAAYEGFWRQSPLIPFGARLRTAILGAIGMPQAATPPVVLADLPVLGYTSPGVWAYVLGEPHRVLLVFVLAMAIGSTLAMAFLPASRRKAGVQLAHLARIGAVMVATVPMAAVMARVAFLVARHPDLIWLQTVASLGILFAWLFVWWCFAARDYIGMTRPALIALTVSSIGFLLGVAATSPWVFA